MFSCNGHLQLYPMLRVTIMLILGIIVGRVVYPNVQLPVWLILTIISLLVSFALHRHPLGQTTSIFVTFFFAGSLLATHSMNSMKVDLPSYKAHYQAVLLTEPSVHGKVIQSDLLIITEGKPIKVRASILRDTVDNRWQRLHVGDGIEASSYLDEPRNFANSTFDYATWLKEHGFKAETFVYYCDWRKAVVDLMRLSYYDRVVIQTRKFRQRLLSRYHDLGADGQNYAVLAAMTLGDKSSLSKDLKDDYSIAGASHVLALSGLHLGIIYGVLSLLTFGFRRKWFPQLLILLAVWTYVVLVGMSASVVRSAMMLTIISLVTLLNRRSQLLNSLSLAAFVLLLFNPLNLYDIGFEMSFMAVLGIALFEPMLQPRRKSSNMLIKAACWIWDIISVSIAAQIGTAPLVAYYFGRFSCYFILTNLIVIPCATIILYGTIATLAVSFLSSVSSLLSGILVSIINLMNNSLHWIASLPGASIENIQWSSLQVVSVYIVIFAFYLVFRFFRTR